LDGLSAAKPIMGLSARQASMMGFATLNPSYKCAP
jgi:hypothetical protein